MPLAQQQQPAYGTPVTGYPDYSAQYQNEYSNFGTYPHTQPGTSGYPQQGYPQQGYPQPTGGKPGNVEMGVPPYSQYGYRP